jgi:hypothetical protein
MTEQVVPELEPVFRIATVEEPAWRVSDPMPDGRRILALRHPGFGWLGFVMLQDRADDIARGLREEAERKLKVHAIRGKEDMAGRRQISRIEALPMSSTILGTLRRGPDSTARKALS